jgi:hypothetical protein
MCGFEGRVETLRTPTRASVGARRMKREERAKVLDSIVVMCSGGEVQWRDVALNCCSIDNDDEHLFRAQAPHLAEYLPRLLHTTSLSPAAQHYLLLRLANYEMNGQKP